MPIGYLVTTALVAAGVLAAVAPMRGSRRRGRVSWLLSAAVNETPFLAGYYLLAASALAYGQGDLDTPVGRIGLVPAGLAVLGFPVIVRRALTTGPAVEKALQDGLERSGAGRSVGRSLPWGRILLAPIAILPRGVARRRNIAYGDAGRANLLDVYRPRSGAARGPMLIHLHGGGFHRGRKSFEGRPLLHRLARNGWVCISANYRLRPVLYPDQLIDAKKVIAWAREHAHEYGADPSQVFIAGSSAGAHLAVTAALSAGEHGFQPGFEDADTRVQGAIGLYGYYGPAATRDGIPSSPHDYVHRDAPPVMLAHGGQDTFVPPEQARRLAAALREVSESPVVHAELPGGQHSFDLFHSIRFEALIDGIEEFASAIGNHAGAEPTRRMASGRIN